MATTQQQIDSTTQKFLDIYDITNDLVILKDGTTSLVITVDAMNFGLLAEEEQDSIMYAYAGLLNSLNYPIQIIIKSQTKDVTGYLRLLKEQEDTALNNVHRQRIMKYREFVSNLIRERNVLDKKFYVTIPAKPLELGLVPVSSVLPGKSETDISTVDKTMVIEKAKSILEPKRDHLIAQFARIGLYSRQLETQEIIQLFYQSYNPEAFEGQSMDDSRSYTAPLVSASIQGISMDTQNSPSQPATPVAQPVQNTPVVSPVSTDVSLDNTGASPNPASASPESTATPLDNAAASTAPTMQNAPAPVGETPQTTAFDTTVTSPDSSQSTLPNTTPMPSSGGYVPSQMSGEQVSTTTNPVSETTAVTQSGPETSQVINPSENALPSDPTTSTSVPAPSATPLPPAPELPKIAPGQVDPEIPQEVEIKIEHPSEEATRNPAEIGTATPTDQSAPVEQTAPQGDVPLPPLPEIQ